MSPRRPLRDWIAICKSIYNGSGATVVYKIGGMRLFRLNVNRLVELVVLDHVFDYVKTADKLSVHDELGESWPIIDDFEPCSTD